MSQKFIAATSKSYSTINLMCSAWISRALFFLLCAVTLAACSDTSDSTNDKSGSGYSALIERTQYGTAHITADDWGSLGFGQGYAAAQDRFCVMADQFLKVRSQRAKYFGPGENNEHINSDFAYLSLGLMDNDLSKIPSEDRARLEGYAAGVNKYLKETGVDNLTGGCAGQPWVQEIDASNVSAYGISVVLTIGSTEFIDEIAIAAPPGGDDDEFGTTSASSVELTSAGGSNGVAFGSDLTANGRGLLLANPHWVWEGEQRSHEIHLTIPGVTDVAGVGLPGVAGVLTGFNESLAWAHTLSPSNQFIVYTLNLVPGNPTRYHFGEEERDMQAETYTIEVLQENGSLAEESRTLYRSHYGPMLDLSEAGLGWTETRAASIFDINANNDTLAQMGRLKTMAQSVDELREVYSTVGGMPANHTLATDKFGKVLYADATLVPNLSDGAEAAFRNLVESEEFNFTKLAFGLGFVALDGSNPFFSVEIDERATVPGVIPFIEAPQLTGRQDFVSNSNDSHWLINPAAPLTGYSIRYGEEETPLSTRTRMGLTQISEGDLWDRDSLKNMLFENRSYTKQLWRDDFVAYCSLFETAVSSSGEVVDIREACTTLANWDGLLNLDSIGAILFRELLGGINSYGLFGGNSYFSQPFDVLDPVNTPNGLSSDGEAYLLGQLADSVRRLEGVGIPIDSPLGDFQYTLEGHERFPIHGGQPGEDGAYNYAAFTKRGFGNSTLLPRFPIPDFINFETALTEDGYLINFGTSFVMVVEFTDEGPVADAILVYSQSDDPDSPHFADQMSLYSSKTWRPLPFTREQIEADPFLTSMRVTN